MEKIKRFMARAPKRACERGASLVEYALLVALISVVCIAAVTRLGSATSDSHQDAADGIGDEVGECGPGAHVGTTDHGPYESAVSCYHNDQFYLGGPSTSITAGPCLECTRRGPGLRPGTTPSSRPGSIGAEADPAVAGEAPREHGRPGEEEHGDRGPHPADAEVEDQDGDGGRGERGGGHDHRLGQEAPGRRRR